MEFTNVYEDSVRADAYSKLEFPGTYYLAYRDLPEIIARHVAGTSAVDFGCGTGRSTRFLKRLGFSVAGIDISEEMLARARAFDPDGDYRLSTGTGMEGLPRGSCDLVLSAFTFDNIAGRETKVELLAAIARLLKPGGVFLNFVSSPEIYVNEWASFSTKDFCENLRAVSGDQVMIIQTDTDDRRPVVDIVCSDEDHRAACEKAGLAVVQTYRPLARESEPYPWINETRIAPWVIYVLRRDTVSFHPLSR